MATSKFEEQLEQIKQQSFMQGYKAGIEDQKMLQFSESKKIYADYKEIELKEYEPDNYMDTKEDLSDEKIGLSQYYHEYTDNPFYFNYIFTRKDLNRDKISLMDYPFLIFKRTYVSTSDGYAWFFKRDSSGKIYLLKYEKL
jgi:hypothetical protein